LDFRQRTLKESVSVSGIGLHSGEHIEIRLRPAPAGSGIRFVRTDLEGRPSVKAAVENVLDTTLATTIGENGCRVATVEHLMASFFGLGIDNAIVELDGPEVPIMDGSAASFVFLIKSAGIKEQDEPKRFTLIKKMMSVKDGDRFIKVYPSRELKITYMIDFKHPLVRDQKYQMTFSGGDFVREISRARTFGFLKDVKTLKENGLAKGGSLDNAVVIDDFRILNEDGLRYKDEFVRHKILDFLGDLSVLGSPVIGHFVVKKAGHCLHHRMLKAISCSRTHCKIVAYRGEEEGRKARFKVPVFGRPEAVSA
jgi:UDP-3-O-[3-hydroxymyristoyl] N-acetylglucosamine deacetylase